MKIQAAALMVLWAILTPGAEAAERAPMDDAQKGQPTIEDFAWLVGHWRGEALGGVAEDVWAPPAGGAMVGLFRLVKDDGVAFYEIVTISEPDLALRLKHFHPDLTGWEERDEVVTFPLVGVRLGEAVFEGLTYRVLEDGRLRAVVETRRPDGSRGELEFVYRRVEPD